jgi:dTDP-4-dehydrorhamnose 3,5-epimerase-like enzyme
MLEATDRASTSRPEHETLRPAGPGAFDGVAVVAQPRHQDHRGFVQKVLMASQWGGNAPRGEVYVTAARPGEAKGNHYHRRMGEWFAVVQGTGDLVLVHPSSGERRTIPFASGGLHQTIYVPAGIAHAVVNTGADDLICVALAEREHDPADVFAYPVWPPASNAA